MTGQTRNFPPLDGYVECAYGGFGDGGAASGMTSSLTWTCPTAGSPRTATATAPSTGRGAAMSHHIKEVRHKRKKGRK